MGKRGFFCVCKLKAHSFSRLVPATSHVLFNLVAAAIASDQWTCATQGARITFAEPALVDIATVLLGFLMFQSGIVRDKPTKSERVTVADNAAVPSAEFFKETRAVRTPERRVY
jgi:hypothetical protein